MSQCPVTVTYDPESPAQTEKEPLASPSQSSYTSVPVATGPGWKVPSTIIGSFVLGVAIAVAHHGFLMALDGKEVGVPVPQDWITFLNNIMSTLAKLCFATSMSVSLTQLVRQFLLHLLACIDMLAPGVVPSSKGSI
jgi:hypothetical protein